jgi:copper transport protein
MWTVAATAIAVLLLLAGASPALAHATLEATDPPSNAVLTSAPRFVTLTFSEPVEVDAGAIRVFNSDGQRVDGGARPTHPDGRASQVTLPVPALTDGVYVVTWRVTSADSHPVHGAFTFTVGARAASSSSSASAGDALARKLVSAQGGSRAVGVLFGVVRFAAFLGLVLLIGSGMFLFGLSPETLASSHRARRLLLVGWTVAVSTTVLAIMLQGVYGAGLPLGDVVRWSVVRNVASTRFGHAWLVRLAALLLTGPLLVRAVRRAPRRSPLLTMTLAELAAVVLVTPGVAGHAGAEHPAALGVGVDALHLGAACFWLGGMCVLLLVDVERLSEAVERYSRLAVAAVVVILATGVFAGWRQTRELDALRSTTYGHLLLIKLGLFAAMLAFAWFSRSWVRRRRAAQTPRDAGAPPPAGTLRRSVGAEAVLAVVVLAATSLLVNAVPARDALAKPFATELRAGPVLVDITIDPAKAGPADVHIYTLTPAGQVTDVKEMTVRLALPARGISGLDVPLQRAGPGHFAAYGFVIPLRGTWQLAVTARTSDIDEATATTTIRIR